MGTVEPGLLVGGVGDRKRLSRSGCGGRGSALYLRDCLLSSTITSGSMPMYGESSFAASSEAVKALK